MYGMLGKLPSEPCSALTSHSLCVEHKHEHEMPPGEPGMCVKHMHEMLGKLPSRPCSALRSHSLRMEHMHEHETPPSEPHRRAARDVRGVQARGARKAAQRATLGTHGTKTVFFQTTRALQWRNTSREQLFSMYRHYTLVSSFGLFAARLLARRILDRLRDAAAVTAPCQAPLYSDPDREAIRDFNLGRSQARGVQHRCARFA
jgi:molybdopterin biosynthesis enzyme